jgi:hypothetical protein
MDFNDDEFDDMEGPLFDGLSELEQMEKEDELLDQAFNNSYSIITREITFDELIIRNDGSIDGVTTVAHDIEDGPSKKDLENIILYFQEKEEYEKCAVLHKMLYP